LMSNITITKIKGMKILSVRLVYGRRSLGIAPNALRLCVCLPLAQCFNLTTNLMGQIAQNRC
jgi:hypothetical protein